MSEASLCAACQVQIKSGEEYLKVGQSSYHVNHFQCNVCLESLGGKKFYTKEQKLWCQSHYEEKFCQKCNGCKKYITSGHVLKALDTFYHPDHFVCGYAPCSKKLDSQYYQRDGLPYCIQHAVAGQNLDVPARDNAVAKTSNEPRSVASNSAGSTSNNNSIVGLSRGSFDGSVTSPGVERPGSSNSVSFKPDTNDPPTNRTPMKTHHAVKPSTFGTVMTDLPKTADPNTMTCQLCSLTVEEADTCWLGGKLYHAACLSCFHCKAELSKSGGLIYKKENHLYCKRDYQNLFLKLCVSCGTFISDMCVSSNDEYYHTECFCCGADGCKQKLDNYLSIEGQLRCSNHGQVIGDPINCSVCSLDVKCNEVLAVAGKRIHLSCFNCSECRSELTRPSARLSSTGLLVCLNCATKGPNPEISNTPAPAPIKDDETIAKLQKVLDGLGLQIVRSNSKDNLLPKKTVSRSNSAENLNNLLKAPNNTVNNNVALTPGFSAHRGKGHSSQLSITSNFSHRSRGPSQAAGQKITWTKGQMIGKGSFGKVYMGLNVQTGQLIAVKQVQITNDEDKEQALSLQAEISLMDRLRHPNIVALLGSEYEGDKLNILMEYVAGKPLDSLLEEFGVLNVTTIQRYTRQLLSALKYLHNNGVVHRDIKGKNILVDSLGNCKLCDFGSAKQFENIVSSAAPSIGYNYTPLWTAPEVLLGNYSRKVDIWSLGCVIIEMATAKTPWAECNFTNPFRALYHIGNTDSIPLIPDHLKDTPMMPDGVTPIGVDFIKKCLTRDPDFRPDAADLLSHPFVSDVFIDYECDIDLQTDFNNPSSNTSLFSPMDKNKYPFPERTRSPTSVPSVKQSPR